MALSFLKRGLFLSFLSLNLIACDWKKKGYLENKPVLKVDHLQLTAKEFGEILVKHMIAFDALSLRNKDLIERVKNKVIHEFINKAIVLKWARKHNVFVRKEQLEKEINFALKSYQSDLDFQKALVETGMNFKDWKKDVHFSLLQKLVYQDITHKTPPLKEKEVTRYYKENREKFQDSEKVKLRQILTKTEHEAKLLMDSLQKGKSLQKMAKKFSIAPEAKKGGNLGWISKGILDVFDQAFKMRVGERSPILKSAYGYHIYEVLGKRRKRSLSLNQVRDKISKILIEQKKQDIYSKWLKNQIQNSKVFINDSLIKRVEVQIDI